MLLPTAEMFVLHRHTNIVTSLAVAQSDWSVTSVIKYNSRVFGLVAWSPEKKWVSEVMLLTDLFANYLWQGLKKGKQKNIVN